MKMFWVLFVFIVYTSCGSDVNAEHEYIEYEGVSSSESAEDEIKMRKGLHVLQNFATRAEDHHKEQSSDDYVEPDFKHRMKKLKDLFKTYVRLNLLEKARLKAMKKEPKVLRTPSSNTSSSLSADGDNGLHIPENHATRDEDNPISPNFADNVITGLKNRWIKLKDLLQKYVRLLSQKLARQQAKNKETRDDNHARSSESMEDHLLTKLSQRTLADIPLAAPALKRDVAIPQSDNDDSESDSKAREDDTIDDDFLKLMMINKFVGLPQRTEVQDNHARSSESMEDHPLTKLSQRTQADIPLAAPALKIDSAILQSDNDDSEKESKTREDDMIYVDFLPQRAEVQDESEMYENDKMYEETIIRDSIKSGKNPPSPATATLSTIGDIRSVSRLVDTSKTNEMTKREIQALVMRILTQARNDLQDVPPSKSSSSLPHDKPTRTPFSGQSMQINKEDIYNVLDNVYRENNDRIVGGTSQFPSKLSAHNDQLDREESDSKEPNSLLDHEMFGSHQSQNKGGGNLKVLTLLIAAKRKAPLLKTTTKTLERSHTDSITPEKHLIQMRVGPLIPFSDSAVQTGHVHRKDNSDVKNEIDREMDNLEEKLQVEERSRKMIATAMEQFRKYQNIRCVPRLKAHSGLMMCRVVPFPPSIYDANLKDQ